MDLNKKIKNSIENLFIFNKKKKNMKYIKKFTESVEILPGDSLTFPDNPIELNGVLDWYNSKKQSHLWEWMEINNSKENFDNLFGDENGNIICSLEDGLNNIKCGKWSRDEIKLFAKYVREYSI